MKTILNFFKPFRVLKSKIELILASFFKIIKEKKNLI